MEHSKKCYQDGRETSFHIDHLIISYYGVSLKNNLEFLNIHSEEEKKVLTSYFFQELDFRAYDKAVGKVLDASIDRMTKNELEIKIDFFLSDKVFPSIDKSQFIPPTKILSSASLTTNILRVFFKRVLYQTILSFVITMVKNREFYNKALDTEIFYDAFLKLRTSLNQYNKTFLNFYTGLVNKYDITGDFIFPVYNTLNDNVYFSKVVYPPLDVPSTSNVVKENLLPQQMEKVKSVLMPVPSSSNSSQINLYRDPRDFIQKNSSSSSSSLGTKQQGVLQPTRGGVSGDEGSLVKLQLEKMFENNIKHVYNKEEIKKLENLLENKKINALIARKELKLSPGFNNIVQSLLNKDISETDRRKFFEEVFDVEDNANLTKEELYDIYKNEPNKDGFIRYVVDKTMHQNILPTKDVAAAEGRNLKVVALVDNIFNKILKEDYDHNTLNLQDDDIKFILMLETLNSIKTSSIGNNSNITVNLFKDVEGTRINKEEIKFN